MSKKAKKLNTGWVGKKLGPPALPVAPPPVTLKLDLACGANCRPGFEGVDIVQLEGVKHVWDLNVYPWPFETSSVAEVVCSHYCEHIPMQWPVIDILRTFIFKFIDTSGSDRDAAKAIDQVAKQYSQDPLFKFFDELHRIMIPDGWAEIIVPSTRSDRAFQDPTHRRFLVENTFLYLNKEWRELNRLQHYDVHCNFGVNVGQTVDSVINTMHPEAQGRHIRNYWNATVDFVAKLKALK